MRFRRNHAVKFLAKLTKKQQERILRAIEKLPQGDVAPVVGMPGYFRLRVGDYRVVFMFEYANDTVSVFNIGNRGDIYKGM
jgi:mRNA interferase RelE/StbE